MSETSILATVLTFLSGGAIVAIIGFIGDRIKFKEQRKAHKEDRAEEKEDEIKEIYDHMAKFEGSEIEKNGEIDKHLKTLIEMQFGQCEALRVVLLDRIQSLGQEYVNRGEITFDERKRLRDIHTVYHNPPLNGNGDADLIMKQIDELPLKK